jgi:hypothetical protein
MTQFATAQELRTMLDGTTLDPVADAEWTLQADALLTYVSADMQLAARNRIIRTTDATAKLAGTWNRDLLLPQRPVVSVTSVALNGNAIALPDYTWNDRYLLRRYGRFGTYSDLEHLAPHDGAHWGGPESTVEVVYTFGYEAASVPVWVKGMCLRVSGRAITNPEQVTQEALGTYSVSYGSRMAAGGTWLTTEETKLLRSRFSRTAGTAKAGSL